MQKEMAKGEKPEAARRAGASAAPSQAPAAMAQAVPRPWRLRAVCGTGAGWVVLCEVRSFGVVTGGWLNRVSAARRGRAPGMSILRLRNHAAGDSDGSAIVGAFGGAGDRRGAAAAAGLRECQQMSGLKPRPTFSNLYDHANFRVKTLPAGFCEASQSGGRGAVEHVRDFLRGGHGGLCAGTGGGERSGSGGEADGLLER
jgi:hypothetical protein